jgi:very-short-patch-repair endonuclease
MPSNNNQGSKKTPFLSQLIREASVPELPPATTVSEVATRNYARIRLASVDRQVTKDVYRFAQYGGNTRVTAPGMYSPFLTPSSMQIPNNRKEIYLWAQWWYDNEPLVAAAIEFYTDFPLSGFTLQCANSYVKDYYEALVKKLNFPKWLPLISQEYHLRGDCFVFSSIECKVCGGDPQLPDTGERCDHEGATWKSLSILNPDMVEIEGGFLDEDPSYYYMPTDDMIQIVQTGKPEMTYRKIAPRLRDLILAREPIPLEQDCIWHLKRGAAPWQPFGTSLVRRMFPTLAYKDKLRQAQWIVAERHIIPYKIVKVGRPDRPASDEEMEAVAAELAQLANDPLVTLIVPDAFEMDFVGASGKVLQLTNEMEQIAQELYDGFMINKSMINGDGPSYSNAQVGLVTMAQRLERFRNEVAYWIEERVFKPVAIWNGFEVEGKRGQKEYVYPTVKWDDLKLRDDTQKLQMFVQAQQQKLISAQTLIELFGLDYDQEVERLRYELGMQYLSSPKMTDDVGTGYRGPLGKDLTGGANLPPLPVDSAETGMMGGMGAGPAGMPSAGGAPAPGAMAANSRQNYRTAAKIINDLYHTAVAKHEFDWNNKYAGVRIKSAAHQDFLLHMRPVTGSGNFAAVPEELPQTLEVFAESNGGPLKVPMNRLAYSETIDRIETRREMVRTSKKKDKEDKEMIGPNLFTKLEQKLYNLVLKCNVPVAFYAQYQAGPGMEYQLDGAFPALKLGIEADSETFHSAPEKIQKDRQRDTQLLAQGWAVLRFTERELTEHPEEVMSVIFETVKRIQGPQSKNTVKL